MFCFTWAFPWYNPPFPRAFFASQTAKAQRIEASAAGTLDFLTDVRFLKKKANKKKKTGNAWK